ncbi:DUF4886 domain-containing protein [Pelobium manganitolerans]|uniref:DUF4886 domain-containing protein n=1 Tax=Pelobium manganitolerans TaxID=1842495 RepID=A0A419S2G7_9SPHI|nr:DUF4886 domain-containing protein [Pelobium manganitolerans]
MRILAIGNSFSEDAIEHFLSGLAIAGGHKIIVGNLFIGAADLDLHCKNALDDKPAYNYRKIDVLGNKKKRAKTSISYALADEKWDYISLQQVSNKSGLAKTYEEPLPQVLRYLKSYVSNPHTQYILHQTWAYKQSATIPVFAVYDFSQIKMYKSITKTSKKIYYKYHFDLLIPSGTAIQNARNWFSDDEINRDDIHLSYLVGRYIASCTWYQKIFKEPALGNGFYPQGLTLKETELAQKAADSACKKPFRISSVK